MSIERGGTDRDQSGAAGVRIPKKNRRSDSSGSCQSDSTLKSQILAMKQYQRQRDAMSHASLGPKTLSDFSDDDDDDDGGLHVVRLGIGSKKRSNPTTEGSKKRRRMTIDSDSSDDDSDASSERSRSNNRTDLSSNDIMKHPAKRKKRTKDKSLGKGGQKHGSVLTSSNKSIIKRSSSSDGAPKRKHGKCGTPPRATAGADTRSPPGINDGPPFKTLSKKELKPLLKVNDEVYAAWWPDEDSRRTNSQSSWYEGRIKSVKAVDKGGDYGPEYYYSIVYWDDDSLDHVSDVFVWPKAEYLLSTNGKKWIGVNNVIDEDPSLSGQWAGVTGWYTATIDGEEYSFSLLSEAMRAYDASVVRRNGAKTKPSDLNLPKEWEFSSRKGYLSLAEDPNDSDEEAMSISALKGVSFNKEKKKYQARINHGGKLCHLGYYKLAVDAALAHDSALGLLKTQDDLETNFATEQDHKNARAMELKKTGLNVDFDAVEAYMSVKIDWFVSKIVCGEKMRVNDTLLVGGNEDKSPSGPAIKASKRGSPKSNDDATVLPKGPIPKRERCVCGNKWCNAKSLERHRQLGRAPKIRQVSQQTYREILRDELGVDEAKMTNINFAVKLHHYPIEARHRAYLLKGKQFFHEGLYDLPTMTEDDLSRELELAADIKDIDPRLYEEEVEKHLQGGGDGTFDLTALEQCHSTVQALHAMKSDTSRGQGAPKVGKDPSTEELIEGAKQNGPMLYVNCSDPAIKASKRGSPKSNDDATVLPKEVAKKKKSSKYVGVCFNKNRM
ncbi:hypothetical protein ACHAXR_004615, partial [Thalassiosira sp. AJA248-18]